MATLTVCEFQVVGLLSVSSTICQHGNFFVFIIPVVIPVTCCLLLETLGADPSRSLVRLSVHRITDGGSSRHGRP